MKGPQNTLRTRLGMASTMTARLTLAYRSMSVYILCASPDPILDRRIGLRPVPGYAAVNWLPFTPPFTIAELGFCLPRRF